MTQFGVYRGVSAGGVAAIPAFEQWQGKRLDLALDFIRGGTWANLEGMATAQGITWGRQSRRMVFGLGMLPDTDPASTIAQGAAGAYNGHFVNIAKALIGHGLGNSTLRLGWEMNGGWEPWRASLDVANWPRFFIQIVNAMRGVSGAAFQFDWDPGIGYLQVPWEKVYPGDAYVDVIGMDIYNESWAPTPPNDPVARWNVQLTRDHGLQAHATFAAAHGKPISFPEWGTGTRPDGHGGGDDPLFIQNMATWIATHNVAYACYWDFPASDYNARLSDGSKPAAAAAFIASFGGASNPAEQPGDPLAPLDPDMVELATLRAAAPVLQAKVDDLTTRFTALQGEATNLSIKLSDEQQRIAAFNAALVGLQS